MSAKERHEILAGPWLTRLAAAITAVSSELLVSDDGRHVVIRPLAYCRETDIERYAAAQAFPIIPCNLCGNQDHLQRVRIKDMLRAWEHEQPGRIENVFRSLQSVLPSHFADRALFDFGALDGRDTCPAEAHGWHSGDADGA